MSTVFSLNSDDLFIGACGVEIVEVFRYAPDSHWTGIAYVCPGLQYDALEVFGTTIQGVQLKQLLKELKAVEEDDCSVFVNRLGLYMVTRSRHPTIKAVRINDYFGWSKYGVKLPQDVTNFTSADMQVALMEKKVELAACKMELEETSTELESSKKEVEEKSMELATCKKELEWSKQTEALWRRLVEEKEKEVETLKNQLLAFKATLRSLADH